MKINFSKASITTIVAFMTMLVVKDNFKFDQKLGFRIKPEIIEAIIPTSTKQNNLIRFPSSCQSNKGTSVTMYMTSHGSMANYPAKELSFATIKLAELGVNNMAVSYLFRGKYLGNKPNAIFKSYKQTQKRNVFLEIKKTSKNKMCTTAFLEWGTQFPTKYNLNPEYLLKDKTGNTSFVANGVQTSYLNVLNPIVRKSILDMIETVATTKGVDAIELDDHFAIENSFGYNREFIELYNLAGGLGIPEEGDPKFKEVRIKILNDLMRDIITVAKTHNSKIRINIMSMNLDFMKSKYNQDYSKMVLLGLSDVGVQAYGRTVPAINSQVQKLDNKTTVSLLLGIGRETVDATTTIESIKMLKQKGFTDLALWGSNSVLYGPDANLRRSLIGVELKKW